MADTQQVPRELFSSDSDDNSSSSSRSRNETVSGGAKVFKEDRFGDALVIEDYETGDDMEALQGKGKEIELLPRGKFKINSEELEFAEATIMDEEEESRKARDSHQFQTVQFKLPGTYCDHCGTLIWGISGKQGLKCDVCNYVCHIDCEKKLTKRCRGYKNKVVDEEEGVEAINNVDKDINFYDDMKNIGCHQFYPKMARRTYCNVCRQSVNLVGKQGLRCAICRYVVHSGCAKDAERNCPIPYHVPDTRKEKIPKHHWIEGNIESGGICIYCAKSVTGGSGMTNFQCFWCKGLIHNSCKDKHHKCDLGQHHNLKLPPHVFQRNPDESDPHKWLVDISLIPEDHSKRPLCVLINRMSGARQGASVIRQLSRLLNPMQIVDIAKGGPRFGIEMFSPLCKQPGSFCILGCGGDGTIGWICEELDKLGLPYDERPCVVPLPIGTGNDLSRVLGWGPGYENEDLAKILDDIEVAKEVFMDRWKIRTFMTEENIQAGKNENSSSSSSAQSSSSSKKIRRKRKRAKSNNNNKSSNTLTRTWERALNLSKEKVSVTRNLGKFRAKQKDKENNKNKNKERKGSTKRRRNKSNNKKNNNKKKNKNVKVKKVVQEVMSDDEGERRKVSRKNLINDSDDDDEEEDYDAKLITSTNESETKISSSKKKSKKTTPLTRRKATLTKSISLPLIGSGIFQKKKEDKEEEEEEEALPVDNQEEKEEKEKDEVEEEGGQDKEDKGKEKVNQDHDDKPKEEEEDEEESLEDRSVPEDFHDMQFVAQKIYNNYFSVGVDAKVALDFHIARESNPENFKSRNYNKFKYFQYGAVSVLGGCKDLNQKISVVIDGKEAKIPNSVEGVVALNLTSYASGTNPWKNNKPAQEWSEQRFDDGLIEIVGVKGTLHLAQIRTGLSTGVQLGQGKRIVFTLKEPLPVQADGEPWLQQAAVMEITLHNKTKMLQRVQPTTMLGQIMSPSNWFQKKKKTGGDSKKNTPRDHNEFGVDEDDDINGETSSTTSTPSTPSKKGSSRKKSLKDDQSPLKSSTPKKGGEGEPSAD